MTRLNDNEINILMSEATTNYVRSTQDYSDISSSISTAASNLVIIELLNRLLERGDM